MHTVHTVMMTLSGSLTGVPVSPSVPQLQDTASLTTQCCVRGSVRPMHGMMHRSLARGIFFLPVRSFNQSINGGVGVCVCV